MVVACHGDFQQIAPLLLLLLLPGFSSKSTTDPVFDSRIPTEVSTVLGETAVLQCRVFQRKNLTVSWLRQDTLHILSAGHYTYVSDARYEAAYMKQEDLWELRIKNIEEKDSGLFECQVSSLPVISYFIRLTVLVPQADIEGDPDLYVHVLKGEEPSQLYGSSLALADLALPFTSLVLLLSIVSGLAVAARKLMLTPTPETRVEGMLVMQ